jgi:hypothetical protein
MARRGYRYPGGPFVGVALKESLPQKGCEKKNGRNASLPLARGVR